MRETRHHHCFTLEHGGDVYSFVSSEGEKRIEIAFGSLTIHLSLKDAAMLSMLAHDLYNGITRRIDRPVTP